MVWDWENLQRLLPRQYKCGHCDRLIASERGWGCSTSHSVIYICPNCDRPTFFESDYFGGKVVPAPRLGESVDHLPDDVERVYDEARDCTSSGAYTSAVMGCRKLLMHVAVKKGAKSGGSFQDYVTYFETKGYIPPDGKAWIDRIRTLGNEANHDLPEMTADDAKNALDFTGMLLKIVYEYPTRAPKPQKAPKNKP